MCTYLRNIDLVRGNLAERVKQLRIHQRLSQRELAERAGVSQTDIVKLERGRRLPSLSALDRIATALRGKIRLTLVTL